MSMISPPNQLIDANGQYTPGQFSASIPTINGLDYDYRAPSGKPVTGWRKRSGYKRFQYFGIVSDELMLGCALIDTGWLGVGFFYCFEPATGRLREFTWRSPLAGALSLSNSPVEGSSHLNKPGVDIRMQYQQKHDELHKSLQVRLADLELDACLTEPQDYHPMAICTRTGVNGWTYANKVAGLPVTGYWHDNGSYYDLAHLSAGGHHDFSAGYMRRETFWNWACLSGQSGPYWLGLNLSCGVNDTSFTENCFWVDGQQIKVNLVHFDYDRNDLMKPWRIRSDDDRVDLWFQPLNRHREQLDAALLASHFHQIFGRFSGQLRNATDQEFTVTSLHGFVEEQYAKW